MKTTILIFSLVSVGQVFAQKMSLCEAIGGLGEQAASAFINIKGEVKKDESFSKTYASTVEISDGLKTEIIELMNATDFVVDYGEFTTESDALAKVESLKNNIIACFPSVRFSDYSFDILGTRSTHLIESFESGFRYYSAKFKIEKWSGLYSVAFVYPKIEKSSYLVEGDPGHKDFFSITNPKGNDQFSQDIRKLVDYGKTGFKDIKGDKIESTHFLFENFDSKFQISGFSNCYVEYRTMGIYKYVIPVLQDANDTKTLELSELYIEKIKTALGTDYAINKPEDGMSINFTHKNQPGEVLVSLVLEIDESVEDSYGLILYVSGYSND